VANSLLDDLDKDTVDFTDNYDGSRQEPTVLPARFPNLLVNGAGGIAVGMATNVPPHNLGEVIDGTIHLIENPKASVADLMQFIKGPDFPTAATICGYNAIKSMYETGRGLLKVRGKAVIEEDDKSGKEVIIITEIPYALNKSSLIEKMAELVREKQIEGISDIRDESDKDGIRVVIELKKGVMGRVMLNNLYRMTQLESTFGAIMLAIDHNLPRVMNLKDLLQCFINHRYEVITRRAKFDLEKALARAHILEGLRIAIDNMDEVVKVIRESRDRNVARTELMSRFGLSEIQASAILEMRLYQLTGLERDKIEAEYKEVMAFIAYLKDLLAHPAKIYAVMKEDLLEVRKQYADPRRTELVPDEGELNMEDLIADRPCVITISHAGYIKRVPVETFREQRRGGKGVAGMDTKDEDFVEHVFSASTHDYLLFFTSAGRVHWKKVYEVPEGSRTSRGKAIVNLLELAGDEKFATLIRTREFPEDQFLVFATANGTVKKTKLSAYSRPRAGGIIAINIEEGDRLIGVRQTKGNEDLMLITRQGMSIRFSEDQLRDMGRDTTGVRGIKLGKENDAVESIEVVEAGGTLLCVSENGYGKRTSFDEYRVQSRGGKGIITMKTSDRNGLVVSAHKVQYHEALMMINAKGVMIRFAVDDLRTISRNTQGVRLINLDEGDKLVSAAPVDVEDEAGGDAETPKEQTETT
jgi:DNA gyrase subunit A